jgi:APA family basic amino acid/polyamine antiporter
LTGVHGIINIPAVLILGILSLILIRGTSESAKLNSAIVIVKVIIVLVFIALGWQFINPVNHAVIVPPNTGVTGEFGWSGVLQGAGIVFFCLCWF